PAPRPPRPLEKGPPAPAAPPRHHRPPRAIGLLTREHHGAPDRVPDAGRARVGPEAGPFERHAATRPSERAAHGRASPLPGPLEEGHQADAVARGGELARHLEGHDPAEAVADE